MSGGGIVYLNLDERSMEILKEIASQGDITSKDLQEQFQLSRNQLDYSIRKINEYLQVENYDRITRSNKGYFKVDEKIKQLLNKKGNTESKVKYIPVESERVQLIVLMLLSRDYDLSLFHFSDALEISKNTVLRDFNKVREFLEEYCIELNYSRTEGYFLGGKEWDIRKLIRPVVAKIYDFYNGQEALKRYGDISQIQIEKLQSEIGAIEKKLNIKYNDKRIWTVPYEFAIITKRIQNKKYIDDDFGIKFNELSDTKEYSVINSLFESEKDSVIPSEEKLYITLLLLSLNLAEANAELDISSLKERILEFLDLFEKRSAIVLHHKQELQEKLYLHLRSAVYRIKYNMTMEYPYIDALGKEYKSLYYLVEYSLQPLEDFVGNTFPKQEIMFISIFIGGYLYNKDQAVKNINALVVCPNGVIFSSVLKNQLAGIFPYINFLKSVSLSEFNEMQNDMQADIVFSSIPIESNQNVVVIKEPLDEMEKKRIENVVFQKLYNISSGNVFTNKIIRIIKKYVKLDPQIEFKITNEIEDTFHSPIQTSKNKRAKEEPNLIDIMNLDLINITDEELDWTEALEKASIPLIKGGYINKKYIESMKNQYEDIAPNIVLGSSIIIPHSKPEDGSKKLGMSFLKINKGIPYRDKEKLLFVVVISTTNQRNHINAMLQLYNISMNRDALEELQKAKIADGIYKILEKYQEVKA